MGKSIQDRLQAVFKHVFSSIGERSLEEITKSNVAEWDSLGHLELIMAVEEEFQIRFSSGKIPLMVSSATILNEVSACMSRQNSKER